MNPAVTIITSINPPVLSKTFALDGAGNLVKSTSAQMTKGRAEVREITTLQDFSDLLLSLDVSQALTYGVPPSNGIAIVTRRAWIQAGRPTDCCTRTNGHFTFRHGPGILFLDYDVQPGTRPLSRDELLHTVKTACPSLLEAGCIWFPSSSSHICNGGADLTGLKGQRLYLLVADASDIPRAGKVLEARLWLAGHGRFEVSKSGSLLSRCLLDVSVFQPSRLDFAAGASCSSPLRQSRGAPRIIPGALPVLDTRKALPELKPKEAKEIEAVKSKAKASIKAKAEAARTRWLEERGTDSLTNEPDATPAKRERIKRTLQFAASASELYSEFVLIVISEDGTEENVTVSEVLAAPDRFDGCRTRDPIEPDYRDGQDCGVLFLEEGNEHLFSFAHGGCRYSLKNETTPETTSASGPTPAQYGVELHCKSMKNGNVVYYWKQDDGQYLPMNGENARGGLIVEGCCGLRERGTPAPVDVLLHKLRVEQNLAYAGRLAGWDAGIHTVEGKLILSLSSPEIPQATPGDYPTIAALLSGMFPDADNRRRFEAWVFHGWDMLNRRTYREHPALALVGPRGCGKTLFVHLLRWMLGNYEMGKAYRFLRGETAFNSELAESCLLVLDDEAASTDMRSRRNLGQALKSVATCAPARIEGKNIDTVTLRPHWRVVICTNDEPEHIQVLPPIDESTADKIIVLSCKASPMPMDTTGAEQKARFMALLRSEVPAWLHAIGQAVEGWELSDGRFMVTGWQDPAILELLQTHTDEERLLEMIDLAEADIFDASGIWDGSSTRLQAILFEANPTRHIAGKILTWPAACGQYLERLSRCHPDRVTRTGPERSRRWRICRAGYLINLDAPEEITHAKAEELANACAF